MFFDPTTEQVIVRIVYEAGGRSPREVLEEVRRLLWVDGGEVVEPMDALARVEHSGGMVSGVPLRNELFACSAAKVGAEAFAWLVENSDAVVIVDDAPDLKKASVTAMREAVARWAEQLRPGTIKMLPPREAPRRLAREARRRAEEEHSRQRAEAERRRAEEEARRAAEEEARRAAEEEARRAAEEEARRTAEEQERRRQQAKRRAEIRAELEAR